MSRTVHASPEQVWAVLTDVDAAATTLRGVTKVERVAGPAYDVGTRWRETRRILGKEETQEMEVTGVDHARSTTVEARAHGVDYRTVFTLEPKDDDTLLTVCFGASHPNPTLLQRATATLFGPVGAAMTSKLLAQDLADIAAVAEQP